MAAKKEDFLNCSLNQDYMAMHEWWSDMNLIMECNEGRHETSSDSERAEWSEMNLCIKCNEGGLLLVCSSDCHLRVHESCLGSAVTLDENGAFLCPYCAYSRAMSKVVEAERKALLAKEDLQAFSSFTVNSKPNKSSTRVDPLMPVVNDDPSCGEKEAVVASADNSVLPEPSTSCLNGVSVADQSMKETEEVRLNVGEGCESPTRIEEHQQTTELPQNSIPQPIRLREPIILRERKVHFTSTSVPSSRR